MSEPTCETCRWRQYGECRRNPPQLVTVHGQPQALARWPGVHRHDFCGEHQPKQREADDAE